jgi:hypothetical protein
MRVRLQRSQALGVVVGVGDDEEPHTHGRTKDPAIAVDGPTLVTVHSSQEEPEPPATPEVLLPFAASVRKCNEASTHTHTHTHTQ